MIENQPPFGSFDGNRTGSNFCALPAIFYSHYETMFSPMDHIRTLAEVNITKRGVTVVAGAIEHHIFIVDPAREKDTIAVDMAASAFSRKVNFSKSNVYPIPMVGP